MKKDFVKLFRDKILKPCPWAGTRVGILVEGHITLLGRLCWVGYRRLEYLAEASITHDIRALERAPLRVPVELLQQTAATPETDVVS